MQICFSVYPLINQTNKQKIQRHNKSQKNKQSRQFSPHFNCALILLTSFTFDQAVQIFIKAKPKIVSCQ